MTRSLLFTAVFALGGCATFSKEKGHSQVAELVAKRTGQTTGWGKGPPESDEVSARVGELLQEGLTRERALAIALVNNPNLQASYEELGVSQADLVQAGLLKNPRLGAHVGFPGPIGLIETEFSLLQELLDLFLLPARKRIASQQFQADILRVGHDALTTAAETSKGYAEVQSAQQMVEMRRMVLDAAQAAAELAQRQYEAGNIADLTLSTEKATYEQAKLDLARDELELAEAREKLNRLLGLWGDQTQWSLRESLPEVPADELPLEHLESLAIRQRLDVDAARNQAAVFGRAVTLAKSYRFVGTIEVGVAAHRDADGPRTIGPSLTLELPIFDQRQAVIARLEAQHRQSERKLAGVSINARSEVRAARTKLVVVRQLVDHHRKVLLPLRAKVLESSQLQYNAMQIGLFQLLAAKQAQVAAYRDYIQAVRDYWIARAELERAVGGRMSIPDGHGSSSSAAAEPNVTVSASPIAGAAQ